MRNSASLLACLLVLSACSGGKGTGDIARASEQSKIVAAAETPRLQAQTGATRDEERPSIANAPDQGTLVGYTAGAAPLREGALSWHPVAISEAHALASIGGGELQLAAPDGDQLRIRYLRHSEQPGGNWTWVGQVVGGDPNQNAIITFGPDAVFGSIPRGNRPPLQLQTRQGALYLVAADASRLIRSASKDDMRLPPARNTLQAAAAARRASNRAHAPASVSARVAVASAAAEATTVDAVVGYSPGLEAQLGSESAAVTRMAYLVEYGNQAMQNSQVSGRLRLVGTVRVDYADSGSNDDTLDDLTEATVPSLAPLHQAREQQGADIALLVRKLTAEHDGCGIAWLLGGGQSPITAGDADWAYGVVSDGSYSEGNTTWYCSDSTFAHEAGHLLGSTHDRANASGTGRYPYSYGINANGVCDVMAYCDDPNVEYQVYSNPRISICGGSACGVVDSEDNARSLDQTIPLIAAFRAAVVPFGGNQRNDFNGDGASDLFWRNGSTGHATRWYSADGATASPAGQVADLGWKALGSGDFDGDGDADIFWRHGVTGANLIWRSASNQTKLAAGGVRDLAWKLVGVGDFDGDGSADLFWRHSTIGFNTVWKSANIQTPRATRGVGDLAWKVVGVGDFDGDGQDDVLWRHSTAGVNTIWKSGNIQTIQTVRGVALAWKVAGIADFDGDGRADILWRNANTGANAIWKSANIATPQPVRTLADQAWKVASTGDFDGDGRADIFWRHAGTGQNTIWLSADYTAVQDAQDLADTAWSVVGQPESY